MSRGCVNLSNTDANWLFRWTTPVWQPEDVIDESGWTCGKEGQGVPVSQGMPTVKVRNGVMSSVREYECLIETGVVFESSGMSRRVKPFQAGQIGTPREYDGVRASISSFSFVVLFYFFFLSFISTPKNGKSDETETVTLFSEDFSVPGEGSCQGAIHFLCFWQIHHILQGRGHPGFAWHGSWPVSNPG